MMLPSANDRTLSRYLLSAAHTIRQQIAAGLGGDAVARLDETAAVVSRVAQQIDGRAASPGDARAEYAAIRAAQAEFEAVQIGSAGTASANTRSIDMARIEAFLRRHPLGGPDVRVRDARLLAGGRCKITALIEQTGATGLPDVLILRQDWDGGATATTVAGEYALLERLFDHGVRVPRPLLVENDPAVLGSPFIMVDRVAGRVAGGLYDPPTSPDLMLQMAEELGRIHAMPLAEVAPLLLDVPRQTARDPADIDVFARSHAEMGIRSAIVDAALDWLRDNTAQAGDALSLVHNDFGFHNALVDGDRLTAVLDWELARIGHPASDLGYVKHFVEKAVPWDTFIARYVAAGGAVIAEETVRYHAIWNAVRLYGLIMVARHNLELGRVNDMEITYACADNVMLLIAFLGEELFGPDVRSSRRPSIPETAMRLPFDGLTRRRLYLVRHGEAAATRESDGLYGDDIVLTEKGLREAHAMAAALRDVPFAAAFCSTIGRARQTAGILVEGRDLDLRPSERFTELTGDIATVLHDERSAVERQAAFAYAMWTADEPDARFFGGDSYGDFLDRTAATLCDIARTTDASDILIVSHSGFQRAALCWALDAGPAGFARFEQDTCCLNILDIDVAEDGDIRRKHLRLANYTPADPVKHRSRLTDGEQLAHRFVTT